MARPQDYYTLVIGKRFDEDGVYGVQCVDGFKHFCRTQLGFNISLNAICNPTGYATSIWDNYEKLGLDKYFDKVRGDSMVDGDWAIWEMKSKDCPYSHIAMFRKDAGANRGVFLGQNQKTNNPQFTQVNINYSGIRGALRPKIYHQEAIDQILHVGSKVKFNGVFRVDGVSGKNNTFTCYKLTGTPTYDYHHIPSTDFDECDSNGNTAGHDQIIYTGSYVKNDNVYEVKQIDVKTDSAKLNINGKDVWIYCGPLLEV